MPELLDRHSKAVERVLGLEDPAALDQRRWRFEEPGQFTLGEVRGAGMVDPNFFAGLKESSFSGPIVQYHEDNCGKRSERVTLMRRDFETLRHGITAWSFDAVPFGVSPLYLLIPENTNP